MNYVPKGETCVTMSTITIHKQWQLDIITHISTEKINVKNKQGI